DDDEKGLYTEQILKCLDRNFLQGYYAQMAAAWLAAECFVTFPHRTMVFLRDCGMDNFTYNKALSKICESRIPSDEVKQLIKTMKR
ncbi:MAG: DNA alkylation repair protein, partial [Lachnospira sp.]|nr:DNA alkylation repair protein [Lachnospira sp.]